MVRNVAALKLLVATRLLVDPLPKEGPQIALAGTLNGFLEHFRRNRLTDMGASKRPERRPEGGVAEAGTELVKE